MRSVPPPAATARGSLGPREQTPAVGGTAAVWGAVESPVGLRYLAHTRVLVRGPASGRLYEFSISSPVQSVDARDAKPLLDTRFFARE